MIILPRRGLLQMTRHGVAAEVRQPGSDRGRADAVDAGKTTGTGQAVEGTQGESYQKERRMQGRRCSLVPPLCLPTVREPLSAYAGHSAGPVYGGVGGGARAK